MSKYWVNIRLDDLYYEVEAEDEEDALKLAFELAVDEVGPVLWDLNPDCNELGEFEEEEE